MDHWYRFKVADKITVAMKASVTAVKVAPGPDPKQQSDNAEKASSSGDAEPQAANAMRRRASSFVIAANMIAPDTHWEQFVSFFERIFMVDDHKAFVAGALLLSNCVLLVAGSASQAVYAKAAGVSDEE